MSDVPLHRLYRHYSELPYSMRVLYTATLLILGTAYLGLGMKASWTLAAIDTRRLFLASLAYLPILFGMLWLGGV